MKPIENKYVRSSYDLLDCFEAGLVLHGAEVKSIKKGAVHLKAAYVILENNQLWLKNTHIAPYQRNNQPHYDPERPRKLLLRRTEINSIIGKLHNAGLTLIPKKVYSKRGLIKVEICLGRGLKKYDKRAKLKKRDLDRETARELKQKR
ncbi:MAG: SsrA-binding protein [Candidatus Kerfeldbacteria bacterium RIFOXYA2_FULL_38_24]|uniref:SsrA-binding protein n=1 Tax=Candidatus Kerfeldbacteria bacterium RIFOXYB2_FULL_38_14 TaxID=1798547 RepID=A0A1G2BCM6_9BACT|nr:MAG: SsrA-binding protein [Candidatus Kerfeldbacteria bacterium RIFOXYA2_FULL_38_24]OGY86339.1 MAG: SsrA-binding protein [Candidatus Kerfeldbacteria bacterium RIFOXYB2_FULL_38_14]OGY88432.1 MAG: SsrA-binding protein [Candidatus Kerfeldbacteria bacterium RIFOXYC2_FULL_38_9]